MPMGLNMKNARTVSFIVLTALSATANSQSGKLNSPTGLLPAAAGLGGIEVPESVSKVAIQVVTIPSAALDFGYSKTLGVSPCHPLS